MLNLSEDPDGRLVVAVSDLLVTENINLDTSTQITLAALDGQGWDVSQAHSRDRYAIEPSIQSTDSSTWLADARGEKTQMNRYTTHIELQQIRIGEDVAWRWEPEWTSMGGALAKTYGRMEHAALWVSEGGSGLVMIELVMIGLVMIGLAMIGLAMIGFSEDGVAVGRAWHTPSEMGVFSSRCSRRMASSWSAVSW